MIAIGAAAAVFNSSASTYWKNDVEIAGEGVGFSRDGADRLNRRTGQAGDSHWIVERQRAAELSGKLNVRRTRTIVGERDICQTVRPDRDLEKVRQRAVSTI